MLRLPAEVLDLHVDGVGAVPLPVRAPRQEASLSDTVEELGTHLGIRDPRRLRADLHACCSREEAAEDLAWLSRLP